MDQPTFDFYEQHSQTYANLTRSMDVAVWIQKFLSLLPHKSQIVDIGCGSGRDLKIFYQQGYEAIGIEKVPALARLSQEYTNAPVLLGDVQQLPLATDSMDGIWACAILLHLSPAEWPNALAEISRVARHQAIVFISVKKGQGCIRDQDGRLFWLYTQSQIQELVASYPLEGFVWEESTGNQATWINVFARINKPNASQTTPITRQAAYQWARMWLKQANIPQFAQEAQWLLDHAGIHQEHLLADPYQILPPEVYETYFSLIQKRCDHCPLAYLLGSQPFYKLDFIVTSDVLIPRPETELLVSYIVQYFQNHPVPIGLDLGTGSGCIAISILHQLLQAMMIAIDISASALEICAQNSLRHGVQQRLHLLSGDLFEPLKEHFSLIPQQFLKPQMNQAGFDFIVSNPPYISTQAYATLMPDVRDYEPRIALLAGDGLDFYRKILQEADRYLVADGLLLLELGFGQWNDVSRLIPQKFQLVELILDHQEIPRVLVLKKVKTLE